ncbi:MAG: excinuclease ABC subunit UvrA [Arcobacteraceae bacterium]|nr:excinuclease ABC subunit UvrA [Arcobacteraceae bacterium]
MNNKKSITGKYLSGKLNIEVPERRRIPKNFIVIKGARENNLKEINVCLPTDVLCGITGVSGSGKSSLAFDTIYAEGQRRYVESLSAYARQFLDQMDKPDVENIEGLSPAIAIEQKTTSRNPRSTVGTVTEVYDYLRLLFARIGTPHCYKCSKEITSQSIQQMVNRVTELPNGTRAIILSPLVRGRKGTHKTEFAKLKKSGFTKVRVNGTIKNLEDKITLNKNKKHNIDVVVDRVILKENIISRLADSLETATRLSNGLAIIDIGKKSKEMFFNEKLSCIDCGISYPEITPTMFSFNSPHGACEGCNGLGEKLYFDPDLIVPDKDLTLRGGALLPWAGRSGKRGSSYYLQILETLADHFEFDLDTPFKKLPKKKRDMLLNGAGKTKINFNYETSNSKYEFTETFEGILGNLERKYLETESDDVREDLERFMNGQPCPKCKGARLKKESLFIKVGGKSIDEVVKYSISDSYLFFDELTLDEKQQQIAKRILKEIKERLGFLSNVGLNYMSLDRSASSISGGEGQRIRLATQIGSSLVGVLYILDEPSIGLHQRDNMRLLHALKRLRDMGNSVLVVEHDEETMRAADYIIDMGPGAGEEGGIIIAEGSTDSILNNPKSITGKYLSGEYKLSVPKKRKKFKVTKTISIKGANEHNLKSVNVQFPVGLITCVTGVSGSGKSTLVIDTLYKNIHNKLHNSKMHSGYIDSIAGLNHFDKVIDIDQSPIGRTPRSNPATYTGLMDEVRKLFAETKEAKLRGYSIGRFSFNVKGGRCEKCQGEGEIKIEMHFLPDIMVKCEDCKGARYNPQTLEIHYRGKTISDILNMSVEEAFEFFVKVPKIHAKLKTLLDVGLGYITLGQNAITLSGGEAQRIKLSKELSKRDTGNTLYILDEPTTGLHFADVDRLTKVLHHLVDLGNSVIVIEHNLDIVRNADWVIDMGYEGGAKGGQVIAQGTPEDIAKTHKETKSYTGYYLEKEL